jgi:hypothetical protein
MAAFEIAFAHKLITATAYMYLTIVSKVVVYTSRNTSRHAFSARRAFAFDDSAGDLPNP